MLGVISTCYKYLKLIQQIQKNVKHKLDIFQLSILVGKEITVLEYIIWNKSCITAVWNHVNKVPTPYDWKTPLLILKIIDFF